MRRVLLAVAGALSALFLTAGRADACDCVNRGRPACEAAWRAAAVFAGEVLEIAAVDPKTDRSRAGHLRVRLRVLEPFTGVDSAEVEVYTAEHTIGCGYRFSRGGRYLVFAHRSLDGPLSVSGCSSTKELRFNGDHKYLRSLKASTPQFGRLRGLVTYFKESSGFWGKRTQPFDGARIIASGEGQTLEVVTGRDGKFEIVAPPGRYKLEVRLKDGLYGRVLTPDVWIVDPKSCGRVEVRVSSHKPPSSEF
jgi:hypothetical protein